MRRSGCLNCVSGCIAAGVRALGLVCAALMVFTTATSAMQGCAISGRVVDANGVPIPSAAVSALPHAGPRDQLAAKQTPASGAVAGPRGEYCIRGLAPGKYIVRAFARKHPPSASPECGTCCGPNMTEYQATFYPSSVSQGRAIALGVDNGEGLTGIDITMRYHRSHCVRGEVRDGNGALMADAAVGLEADSWSTGVINEGGRFLLTSLPEGTYTIVISDRPKLGRILARRVIRVTAGSSRDIVIRVPSISP